MCVVGVLRVQAARRSDTKVRGGKSAEPGDGDDKKAQQSSRQLLYLLFFYGAADIIKGETADL